MGQKTNTLIPLRKMIPWAKYLGFKEWKCKRNALCERVCVCVCALGGVYMELIGLVEGVNSTIGGVSYDARALFCSLLCRWDSNATEPNQAQIMPSPNSSFQSTRTWGPHKRHGHRRNAASFIPKPHLVGRNCIFFSHFRWQILSKEEQPLPEPSSSSEREGSDLRKRRCARGASSCPCASSFRRGKYQDYQQM